MKKILLLVIGLFPILTFGQNSYPKMELKPNGFVAEDSTKNYIVLDFPEQSKDQLYKSALTYLNSIYNNPQRVLNVSEGESIVVNGFTNSIKGSLDWYEYPMNYQILIEFKDARIRVVPSILSLEEIVSKDLKHKYYVKNTDSSNSVEINSIYMWSNKIGGFFLFQENLKNSIDSWLNAYISMLGNSMQKEDW